MQELSEEQWVEFEKQMHALIRERVALQRRREYLTMYIEAAIELAAQRILDDAMFGFTERQIAEGKIQ